MSKINYMSNIDHLFNKHMLLTLNVQRIFWAILRARDTAVVAFKMSNMIKFSVRMINMIKDEQVERQSSLLILDHVAQ